MFYWYLEVLNKYGVFEGRASRKEYWMFVLVNGIISTLLLGIDFFNVSGDQGLGMFPLSTLYSFAIFLPNLAVGVRRLHDIGRSWVWLLLPMIPFVGGLILFYFLVQDSNSGSNIYGDYPKYE